MIIPIGTDNRLRRNPTVNYVIIGLNVLFYVLTKNSVINDVSLKLYPASPRLHQFITYAFLHADMWHILGNMLFLYIFGNNVNDKLGHVGYTLFYLAAAVFSGLGHVMLAGGGQEAMIPMRAMVGASGAIAAVTGAYMVLFPQTYIHVLYWLFFIGTLEVPALYFIAFKLIVWDNVIGPNLGGAGNVAYDAHLFGYVFGFAIPMAMLALKLLPHSHFDLWAMVNRWRRRQVYRSATSDGYDPFSGQEGNTRRKIKVQAKVSDLSEQDQEKVAKLRGAIHDAVYSGNLEKASQIFLDLIEIDNTQIMPQQTQLDVSNKLMQNNHHYEAAAAYENFLRHYPRYPFTEQVQLMLGLLYSRYLKENDKAKKHLTNALEKLTDPGQKQMCRDELARL